MNAGKGIPEKQFGRETDGAERPGAAAWPLAVIGGTLAALSFTSLPHPAVLAVMAAAGLVCLARPASRVAGIALLAASWALFQFGERLDQRMDGTQARALVFATGRVASVPAVSPGLVRFRFEPERGAANPALPPAIRVSWYHRDDTSPALAVGEKWRLELRLQPPWGRVNFSGSDPERWLFANDFGAVGSVRSAERMEAADGLAAPVQTARQGVARAIRRSLEAGDERAVLLALAVADRSELDDAVRDRLIDTGTAHLLAISGLHVGLAAAAGFWLCRLLVSPWPFFHRGRRLLLASSAAALGAALAYAGLANLGVSTLRAVAMIAVVVAALTSTRRVHTGTALALAAALVLVVDPFAPLGAGFWFSFGAVAALLAAFAPAVGPGARWRRPFVAQLAVMLVLLPVSAAWFGLTSAVALPANLLAIPWVSFVLVPPVLAGIALLPVDDGWAALSWQFAGRAAAVLLEGLRLLSDHGPRPIGLNALDAWRYTLALAGAFLLLLPGVFRWKWLALFALLPLVLPARHTESEDTAVLEVLDAGQGTAAILHTASKSLLYDSGPGDGGSRNLVRPVIAPAFGASAPDRVVISHGDLDHAGGLQGIVSRFPEALVTLNSRDAAGCLTGWGWSWGPTRFRALHPSSGLPYLGNDSSCALSVVGPAGRLLLPGDVSSPIEQRLLAEGLPAHDVLLVPHHGSLSSSAPEFLDRVRPELAVATAALGNRFDFPRNEVRERYRRAGIPLLTTGECGAIRVYLRGGRVERIATARRERPRIWRWPAAPGCP